MKNITYFPLKDDRGHTRERKVAVGYLALIGPYQQDKEVNFALY